MALVIGNDTYDTLPALNNARADARGMAEKLRSLGFEVILKLDAGRRSFGRALAEFEGKAADAEVGLVFYAGHGIQSGGSNYIVPSDAQIEAEEDLRYEGLDYQDLLEAMKRAGTRLNIVILDACRDNPLPKRTRSATRGLTVTAAPVGIRGTAIVYSAAPGQTAQDGPDGGHGVFTEALLRVLDRPGLSLEQVFKETAVRVARATNNRQKPWINSSVTGEFVFNSSAPPGATAAPSASGTDREALFWSSIKDSKRASDHEAYLRRYPNGTFADLARSRALEFKPKQTAALPPPTKPAIRLEPIEGTYVAQRNANVRAAPDVNAPRVATLPKGSKVHVAGKVASKDWLAVDRDGKRLGYVYAKLLRDAEARFATVIPPNISTKKPIKNAIKFVYKSENSIYDLTQWRSIKKAWLRFPSGRKRKLSYPPRFDGKNLYVVLDRALGPDDEVHLRIKHKEYSAPLIVTFEYTSLVQISFNQIPKRILARDAVDD
ncbi:MAG: SH3 domain-containing protein [Rhodospirillaceae bacterium]|nr:SH3 domain-containing protein [Rhodospirillaceae bacterium]MBT5193159.1 SH3 domain-containing protein [Rhodospirillaceae bacterium]MBT5897307.1 SH3 domain-containing protein [Rhodospirillaceae bacterium]MBT6431250.1 SH3 domain-containing protein [Rhodospirillaceae bacterium]